MTPTVPAFRVIDATDKTVLASIDGTPHKVSRRAVAVACSWMADTGETTSPLAKVRLPLADWQAKRDAFNDAETRGSAVR